MIANMLSNKKLHPIVTELEVENYIVLLFLLHNLILLCQKNIRLNFTHYFIMKIPKKQEFQEIAFNNSSDIDFQDFMNLYKKCAAKLYSFLVTDATLTSDNSLRFRKNHLERI